MPKIVTGSVSVHLQNLKKEGPERTQAEEFVYARYFAWLYQRAKSGLSGLSDGVADPEVVASSTLRRSLRDIEAGVVSVSNRQQLAGILASKLADRRTEGVRRALAKKRGAKETVSLDQPLRADEDGDERTAAATIPNIDGSGVEDVLIGQIHMMDVLKQLTVEDQLIAAYLFMGINQRQTAVLIGKSEDFVQRRVIALRKEIVRHYTQGDDPGA